jgi:hypothetical protein
MVRVESNETRAIAAGLWRSGKVFDGVAQIPVEIAGLTLCKCVVGKKIAGAAYDDSRPNVPVAGHLAVEFPIGSNRFENWTSNGLSADVRRDPLPKSISDDGCFGGAAVRRPQRISEIPKNGAAKQN